MSRAVIVTPEVGAAAGGVERMCTLLSGVLGELGWEVTMIDPDGEPSRWAYRVGAGNVASSRLAGRRARELAPELLVTNGALGAIGAGAAQKVHVYHGTLIGNTLAERRSLSAREAFRRGVGGGVSEALAGRRAAVVCVSEQAAEEVRRFYRLKVDSVLPNGVDTTIYRPRPRGEARDRLGLRRDGRYCLFVGRFEYRKGADLLAPACRAAGYELLVAGAGEAPGGRSLGVLDPEQLGFAYAAADCMLFPSRYEACSYVVLEALAAGTPLVSTRVGWMPSFLQAVPEYDVLCVELDVGQIVERLRGLEQLASAELLERARAYVQAHNSLDSFAAGWRRLLDSLGFPKGRPRGAG